MNEYLAQTEGDVGSNPTRSTVFFLFNFNLISMKQIMFVFAVVALMASCSIGANSEETQSDSTVQVVDTVAVVDTLQVEEVVAE